ncbi:hypothetical protein DFQ01_10886 [Paenibacillus cellulosilyticus]|uniref:Uncharacterized protein n=1 Tax=Paenibacillus cellulosilyticus TaxID=375489 RepID=A0A2V2YTD4_9BACL|nr:hypothetical protein [Paenibacillus cellulosilyticus]PWW02809.1 hypothetical protein DFQ01_10886 [Paenibacillus cellulosilyticus]QKS45731.1 hypothetical protein HUB94_15760 [Paenibacillus cellulosilyticus]
MQILATFEYSTFVEIAITELEQKGITTIYAVPLDLRKKEPRLLDSIHRADGMSFIDKGMIFAFMLGTIGASKGFVWPGGPIIWGIGGAFVGFLIGTAMSWVIYRLKRNKNQLQLKKGKTSEVILIVTCEDHQVSVAEDILWDHKALGLAITK